MICAIYSDLLNGHHTFTVACPYDQWYRVYYKTYRMSLLLCKMYSHVITEYFERQDYFLSRQAFLWSILQTMNTHTHNAHPLVSIILGLQKIGRIGWFQCFRWSTLQSHYNNCLNQQQKILFREIKDKSYGLGYNFTKAFKELYWLLNWCTLYWEMSS